MLNFPPNFLLFLVYTFFFYRKWTSHNSRHENYYWDKLKKGFVPYSWRIIFRCAVDSIKLEYDIQTMGICYQVTVVLIIKYWSLYNDMSHVIGLYKVLYLFNSAQRTYLRKLKISFITLKNKMARFWKQWNKRYHI